MPVVCQRDSPFTVRSNTCNWNGSSEYNSGRIEVDAMLPQVDRVLRFVPIKTHAYTSAKSRIHILVYTKLRPNVDS